MFKWFIYICFGQTCRFEFKIYCLHLYQMKYQVEEKEHFQYLLLSQFNCKVSVAEAAWNIQEVYGEDAMGESTAQKWFSQFKEGCFDLNNASYSGRISDFDEEHLNSLIHDNPHPSMRELADIMECYHSTIVRHLHSMEKFQKLGAWIPYSLTENKKTQCVATSTFCSLVTAWQNRDTSCFCLTSSQVMKSDAYM